MKIGTVTFHNGDNYGAVLQAFGLQKTLIGLGHDNVLLNFPAKKKETKLQNSPLLQRIIANQKIREDSFLQFREKHLKSENFSPDNLNQYDIFITGSDQVWNPSIIGGKSEYLLSFADNSKRFSYSASFGLSSIPEEYAGLFSEEIARFSRISVREKSGIEIVKKLTGREAESHIDPSLLLAREEYERIMAPREECKPYLLLVAVQNDIALLNAAKEEAQKRGLELRIITASYFPQLDFAPWSGVSVEKYLRLIHDAEVVLTSSFHGLAFSLVFEKEFLIKPLTSSLANRNSRLTELMDELKITDRNLGNDIKPLDWIEINSKLEGLKNNALSYLKEITGSAL